MTAPEEGADVTAPDEGAAPARRYPSTLGGACYVAVLIVVLVGLVLAATADWRIGIRTFSGALGAAALLRLVLPEKEAGMLAVRHRLLDVAVLFGIGLALFLLAATIPEQPV